LRLIASMAARWDLSTDELKLSESGLDSLSFAIVIMRRAHSRACGPVHVSSALQVSDTLSEFV